MTFFYTDFVNGLFDPTANVLGGVDFLSDTIVLAAVDIATYVADQDADVSVDDIPGGAIITAAGPTGLAVVSRSFTFDPVTFTLVTGPDIAALVLYKDTGTPSTSPLIAYLDDAASGLPVTPNGGDIQVNPGAGGIAFL